VTSADKISGSRGSQYKNLHKHRVTLILRCEFTTGNFSREALGK
jgi:hypothetical protein